MDTSSIFGVSGASSEALSLSAATENNLGKQDFLKLLVAQLAHQDPLQPMENSEFVAQLAQFSSLEQLVGVNTNLSLLQVGQAAITNSSLAGLVGKEVEANGSALTLSQPGPAAINFELGGAAQSVTLTIRDSRGSVVRTLELGGRAAGVNTYTWDGKNSSGLQLPAGSYQIEVKATDGAGASVSASTRLRGVVTGVTYKDGVPLLEIGGTTVRVGDVVAVRAPSSGQ